MVTNKFLKQLTNPQMKRLFLVLIVFLPLIGNSQSLIDTLCFELPYRKLAPAPCSIEDTTTTETKLYMVKVGLYDRNIKSREYIIKLDLGSQYHYFYYQIFKTREKATKASKELRELGYCDSYVVELPDFIKGFDFIDAGLENEAEKIKMKAKTSQVQSTGKVTWLH
jgi:hypothetical protein